MEEIRIPSAAQQPQMYKETLLALLGEQDPLHVLAATPGLIMQMTSELKQESLMVRPAEGEWSAHELLGHFLDAEIAYAFRWRMMLAEEQPTYPDYNEAAWGTLPKPPFATLLRIFEGLRESNLYLLHQMRASWDRIGIHALQGPERVDVTVRKMAGHDLAHLNQLERTLALVTQGSAS